MTAGINKKLIELINWFNSLDHDDQISVLGYLYERTDDKAILKDG